MYENPEGPNLAVPYFFVAALLFDFRRFIIFLSVTMHHRNIKILATETYKFLYKSFPTSYEWNFCGKKEQLQFTRE